MCTWAGARLNVSGCCCSFMSGYHVHEKAVLMALLPLALPAARTRRAARAFLLANTAGHCALLPLLFTRNEYPIKVSPPMLLFPAVPCTALLDSIAWGLCEGDCQSGVGAGSWQVLLVLLYSTGSHALLAGCLQEEQQLHGRAPGQPLLRGWELWYMLGLAAVELYCCALHALVAPGLPFLPLLLTSVYCAVGLALAWWCLGGLVVQPVHALEKKEV